jgi:hypothetical protein
MMSPVSTVIECVAAQCITLGRLLHNDVPSKHCDKMCGCAVHHSGASSSGVIKSEVLHSADLRIAGCRSFKEVLGLTAVCTMARL